MIMWFGIVQNVRVMESKGEGGRRHGIWKAIGGVVGTWSKKPQILFEITQNLSVYLECFYKAWNQAIILINVLSNTYRHILLQWILYSSFVWIFCSIRSWWNEL